MSRPKKTFLFYRFSRKIVEIFFRIFYKPKIYGAKQHLKKGKAVIAPNHVSYFDPPFIGVASPEVIHYFARDSLFKIPVLGFLLRSYNVHPISSQSTTKAFKLVVELLEQDLKVVIFPEGTRSKEDKIIETKPGFAMIAQMGQSDVIPVYVHGAYDIWSRYRKWPKLTGRLVCVFGSAISQESFKSLNKKEARKAMMEAWENSVNELKKWYLNGAQGTPP